MLPLVFLALLSFGGAIICDICRRRLAKQSKEVARIRAMDRMQRRAEIDYISSWHPYNEYYSMMCLELSCTVLLIFAMVTIVAFVLA